MDLTMTGHDFSLLSITWAPWAAQAATWQQRISEGCFENYTTGEDISRPPALDWERAYWFRTYDHVILAKSYLASLDQPFTVLADLRDEDGAWIILTNYLEAAS